MVGRVKQNWEAVVVEWLDEKLCTDIWSSQKLNTTNNLFGCTSNVETVHDQNAK